MRTEFTVHRLNAAGMKKATAIAEHFSDLLDVLEEHFCGKEGRDIALVRTELEKANFYAKRAMASKKENQE